MAISDNIELARASEEKLIDELPIRLGVNKKNELVRLLYEICSSRGIAPERVLDAIGVKNMVEEGRSGLFQKAKKALMAERYPSADPDSRVRIMPVKISGQVDECVPWRGRLAPKIIYLEEEVEGLEWTSRFLGNFPSARVRRVNKATEVLGHSVTAGRAEVYNKRLERIFLVRNRSAFIKICPCSRDCVRCGYWILNVGFGCPMDCSYCYLQTYNRLPGMMLPANIEEYSAHVERFDREVKERTRIGTGEFTDSLAFDRYTGYSSYLVGLFRRTEKLVLELKTKTTEIGGLLEARPHDNVVVSWSMNTRHASESYEKGGADISDRIKAAATLAGEGYRVGFHFDPVIYYDGWKKEYRQVVGDLFSSREIRDRTAWISLGTLRYTPGLKQVAENRFSYNRMFYEGEFFPDDDGKLRYTRSLRKEIYDKMAGWIRDAGVKAWVYLCMETEDMWKDTLAGRSDRIF